jgi:uncharacterized membrane protein YkvA (DUF1232 family)
MTEDLPATLPEGTSDVYRSYLKRASLTRELLTAKVKRYIDTISQARSHSKELDIGTASSLGTALLRLLRECDDSHLPHVQAAVLYFIESDDAEPDLTSDQGFLDDAEVYNAVCRHIGLKKHFLEI